MNKVSWFAMLIKISLFASVLFGVIFCNSYASVYPNAGRTQQIFFTKPHDEYTWAESDPRITRENIITSQSCVINPKTRKMDSSIAGMYVMSLYPGITNPKEVIAHMCALKLHIISSTANSLIYQMQPCDAQSNFFVYGKIMRGKVGLYELSYGSYTKLNSAAKTQQIESGIREARLIELDKTSH